MGKLDKINIEGQIRHMEQKGITFCKVTKEKAKLVLSDRNYYFRLKSYANNFSKAKDTKDNYKYTDLDFEHLEEFAILDLYFKNLILKLVYPIEHFLKVMLLTDYAEKCSDKDGCDVVRKYLLTDPDLKTKLNEKLKQHTTGYSLNLLNKYTSSTNINVEDIPIWALVELLSFADFEKIGKYFYRNIVIDKTKENYFNDLFAVRKLRNATSHNTCLLNTIKKSYNINQAQSNGINFNKSILKYYLQNIKLAITDEKLFKKLFTTNLVFHDFCVSLWVFKKVATKKVIQYFYEKDTKDLLESIDKRISIYKENIYVSNYLDILKKILDTNIFP